MSIKDDLNAVKQEISAEEKFLENFIKLEGFYKRYKTLILALVACIVVGIAVKLFLGYQAGQKIHNANAIYSDLQKGPNANLEEMLKLENPALHRAYQFQQASQQNSVAQLRSLAEGEDFIAELAGYQLASLERSASALSTIGKNSNALKDLALLQEAYLLLQEGKIEEGHRKLQAIEFNSPVKQMASLLEHYRAGEQDGSDAAAPITLPSFEGVQP